MSKKYEEFLSIWFIVVLINQIFIFHACFYPTCIIAALPHTALVTFLFLYFFGEGKKDSPSKEDEPIGVPRVRSKRLKRREKNKEKIFLKELQDLEPSVKKKLDPLKAKGNAFEEKDLYDIKSLFKDNEAHQYFENLKKEIEKGYQEQKKGNRVEKSESSVKKKVDPLKAKGDAFEKYIGKKFEDKGELVIYNGFIKGYEDKGVDVISLCFQTKSINLVQCKNWTRKSMFLNDIQNIHSKLSEYDFDFCNLSSKQVNQYLQLKKDNNSIETILQVTSENLEKYTIRKTLYVSSEKVMDLRIGEKLMMMKPNIYRYEDMKIVVHGMA